MIAEAVAGVWCGRCGKPAKLIARSIDPRYPMVRCGHPTDAGGHTGCGAIAGIVNAERADTIRDERHREQLLAAHDAHVSRGEPREDCPACEAEPPRPRAVPHDLDDTLDRRALVKHLRIEHGLRTDLTNERRYPFVALRDIHAGRHRP
jgi:hypothetical protein